MPAKKGLREGFSTGTAAAAAAAAAAALLCSAESASGAVFGEEMFRGEASPNKKSSGKTSAGKILPGKISPDNTPPDTSDQPAGVTSGPLFHSVALPPVTFSGAGSGSDSRDDCSANPLSCSCANFPGANFPGTNFLGADSPGEYLLAGRPRLDIPIAYRRKRPLPGRQGSWSALAGVIKDGGDDPDVTHESLIEAEVLPLALVASSGRHSSGFPSFVPASSGPLPNPSFGPLSSPLSGPSPNYSPNYSFGPPFLPPSSENRQNPVSPPIVMPLGIHIFAGSGVGTVTLPGLPVAVGEAAINPEPRLQIAAAVWEQRQKNPLWRHTPLAVIIRVRDGESIAKKTLNPRLGIVGGISILGTRGTVRPFSHEAWEEAVRQSLSVCKALNLQGAALCTGRRSEELARRDFPHWPEQAFIQAADYAASALSEAGRLGFKQVVWVCFWGKLVKLAQGLPNTHARSAPLDLNFLADESALFSPLLAEKIRNANTAMEALACIQAFGEPFSTHLINFVGNKALAQAQGWFGAQSATSQLRLLCFDSHGRKILSL